MEGMDVVRKIGKGATDQSSRPLKEVKIESCGSEAVDAPFHVEL